MNALIRFIKRKMRKTCALLVMFLQTTVVMCYWSSAAIFIKTLYFVSTRMSGNRQLYFFHQEGMKNWKFHVRFRLTLLLGWLGGGSNFKLCIRSFSFMLKKTQFLLTGTG